jgi:hypothetical protein
MADTPNSAAEALARPNMPLLEAMMTQRAVRRVRPDPVDDAIVLKCIELALRAPTGSNGQNWEFIVVKDRRIKEGRYGPTTRRPVEEVTHLDAYGNRAWLDAP